jgi:dipeptidyl aminopeptidase/acylaminoacyl peptidase
MSRLTFLSAVLLTGFAASSVAAKSEYEMVKGPEQTPSPPMAMPDISKGEAPIELFGQLPFLSGAQLSPDGKAILAKVRINEKERLGIIDYSSGKPAITQIPIPEDQDLVWYRWAGANNVLLSLGTEREVKIQGDRSDTYETRMLAFNRTTSKFNYVGLKKMFLQGDNVIFTDPAGEYVLLQASDSVSDWPEVHKISIDGKTVALVQSQRPGVSSWTADGDGIIRAGLGFNQSGPTMVYRSKTGDNFSSIKLPSDPAFERRISDFRIIPGSDRGIVLSNLADGFNKIYEVDFKKGEIGKEIFAVPGYDISSFSMTRDGKQLRAISYSDDRARVKMMQPAMDKIYTELKSVLSDKDVYVVSNSLDESKLLVAITGDTEPGSYWMFDTATSKFDKVADLFSGMRGVKLGEVKHITYKARDGLEIPAYLTLPANRSAKNLPLVVYPHGGPFGVRDNWGYDGQAQAVANRGYAVIQPQYRGSGGYGLDYELKGAGEWSAKMQDDLDDSVTHLANEGIVDPKRVCMMGASYGGYTSLVAAYRNPDIYRCTVSYVGVADVGKQIVYSGGGRGTVSNSYFRNFKKRVKGDNGSHKTISPVNFAKNFKVPVLIGTGLKDPIVPPSQSREMSKALTAAGVAHEYVEYVDAPHGFYNSKDQIDFINRVVVFLGKHNPAYIAGETNTAATANDNAALGM